MKSVSVLSKAGRLVRHWNGVVVCAVVLCVLACPIQAAVVQVELTPPAPVAGSPFTVTVKGYFPDLCWSSTVTWSSISVVGNVLTIAIIDKDNWVSGPCLLALQQYRFTQQAPPLAPGRYTLAVVEYHNSARMPDPELFFHTFDVTGTVGTRDTVRVPFDAPTIQAGIDMAKEGGVVRVEPGIYRGTGNRDLDFHGKAVTVEGRFSFCNEVTECFTLIDCQGSPAEPHRAFNFHSGEDYRAVVKKLFIHNGYSASNGGAILCDGAAPTIDTCFFALNSAAGYGGAVAFRKSVAPIVNACTFTANNAGGGGGAMASFNSSPDIKGGLFRENTAVEHGGAAVFLDQSAGIVMSTKFQSNNAGLGGAVMIQESSTTLDICLLTDNRAVQGSALAIRNNASPVIKSSTFYGNSCDTGATIYVHQSASSGPVSPQFIQDIIAFNGTDHSFTVEGASPVLSCTDIYGNPSGDWTEYIADQLGTNGNISADPLFCDPVTDSLWITNTSPCAPENNSCHVLIGFGDIRCFDSPTDVGDGDLPDEFTLDQNYPNPFNPSTVVEYTLPRESQVTITIYNLLGQEVRKLVDEMQSAGHHKVIWDGRDNDGVQMASGAYFYRLVAGDLVATKKMVLIK